MSGRASEIRGERFKGKGPRFAMLYRDMIRKEVAWKRLSASAKVFYLYLKAEYYGSNNGRIRFRYREARDVKGISSRTTFSKAQDELINGGWIECRCQGGKRKRTNLYTLTGKYDKAAINPTKVEEEKRKSIDASKEKSKVDDSGFGDFDELLRELSKVEEDKPSVDDLFDDRSFDDLFEETSV